MTMENRVHIEGVVKRDAEASSPRPGVRVMNFTLSVQDPINDGMLTYVDCFAATDIVDQMDGYVEEGETMAIDGFLTFRTITDYKGRKKSTIIVYVQGFEELGE